MKILIVTGLIGSGKSMVSGMLRSRSIPVYDCDSAAKAIYKDHPDLAREATPQLFLSKERLENFESRLFPLLMEDFRAWAQTQTGARVRTRTRTGAQDCKSQDGLVAMESATILQKSYFDALGDYVLWVDAPESVRLQRALDRGGISRESLLRRMALQKDDKNNPRVSFVLDNSSDKDAAERQLDKFLKEMDYVKGEN